MPNQTTSRRGEKPLVMKFGQGTSSFTVALAPSTAAVAVLIGRRPLRRLLRGGDKGPGSTIDAIYPLIDISHPSNLVPWVCVCAPETGVGEVFSPVRRFTAIATAKPMSLAPLVVRPQLVMGFGATVVPGLLCRIRIGSRTTRRSVATPAFDSSNSRGNCAFWNGMVVIVAGDGEVSHFRRQWRSNASGLVVLSLWSRMVVVQWKTGIVSSRTVKSILCIARQVSLGVIDRSILRRRRRFETPGPMHFPPHSKSLNSVKTIVIQTNKKAPKPGVFFTGCLFDVSF